MDRAKDWIGMSVAKCSECYIGHCRPISMTYMRRLGSHMVILPGAPASRCDICGSVQFDPDFEETMQSLIESLAHNPKKKSPEQSPLTERAPDWVPVRDGR